MGPKWTDTALCAPPRYAHVQEIRCAVVLTQRAALEQLDRLKTGTSRLSEDVRDVLQWLDDATSAFPNAVTLQGGFETFETWTEVERFALPKTLFSETDPHEDIADDLPDHTARKLTLGEVDKHVSNSSNASGASPSLSPSSMRSTRSSASPISPPTSPAKVCTIIAVATSKSPSYTEVQLGCS